MPSVFQFFAGVGVLALSALAFPKSPVLGFIVLFGGIGALIAAEIRMDEKNRDR